MAILPLMCIIISLFNQNIGRAITRCNNYELNLYHNIRFSIYVHQVLNSNEWQIKLDK